MPSYPVLQPDGQLAVWSTIVNHFLAFDCTAEKAAQEIDWQLRQPNQRTIDICAAVQRGEKPFDHWGNWTTRVGWALHLHGEDDETVQEALKRTPDKTLIMLYRAVCETERAADDARFAYEDALKQVENRNAE